MKQRSQPVVVGANLNQVRAWLITDDAGRHVTVNAFSGVGVAVDLSLDDAAELRDGLDVLLRQAQGG